MKSRLEYIDILKGWAILCIALLHYENGMFPPLLNVWIGTYMVTAFYLTSGWVNGITQKNISVKELFFKRLRTFGTIYLWFTALYILFDLLWVALGIFDWKYVAREIYKTITLRGIGTLWFLPALMGGEIIFAYLRSKKKPILYLLSIIITLVYMHTYSYWLVEHRNINTITQIIDAPFKTIFSMLQAWPIIAVGYWLAHKYSSKIIYTNKVYLFLLSMVIIAISVYTACFIQINIGSFNYFPSHILGPLGLLLLAIILQSIKYVDLFFSYWGRNSLILMVTHYSIIQEICIAINKYILHEPEFTGINTIYFFIATILLEYPIIWFFNNKAKFMIGK